MAEVTLPFLGLALTGLAALAFASSWKTAATFKSLDYWLGHKEREAAGSGHLAVSLKALDRKARSLWIT